MTSESAWLVMSGRIVEAARDLCEAAFIAGFKASGEGYNGEYYHGNITTDNDAALLEAHLKTIFDAAWQKLLQTTEVPK